METINMSNNVLCYAEVATVAVGLNSCGIQIYCEGNICFKNHKSKDSSTETFQES